MSEYDDIVAAALLDSGAMEDQAQLSITDDDVGNIQKLSAEMMRLEDYVELLADLSKTASGNLSLIREQRLPDALTKAQVKSFELIDGSKITLSKKYIGSIAKGNEDDALAWFKETKRSGVITPLLTVETSKGHLEEAEELAARISTMGISCVLKPSVHWQTLRAVVREMYEAGDEIPDCISTFVINEVKIKGKS